MSLARKYTKAFAHGLQEQELLQKGHAGRPQSLRPPEPAQGCGVGFNSKGEEAGEVTQGIKEPAI